MMPQRADLLEAGPGAEARFTASHPVHIVGELGWFDGFSIEVIREAEAFH
jgi:hypothetical protein